MDNHDMRPLDQETFLVGLGKLQRIYSPHDTPAATDALLAAYEDVFFWEGPHRPGLAWVTAGLFRRAVTWTLAHVEPSPAGVPAPKELVERCRELKAMDDRRRAAADQDLTRPALAAPQVREAEAVDPQDPYSCTPEERRRWAEQDVWIRAWATRLPERLPPSAPEWERAAWERNQRVANWPKLTPAARRAKERRIAGERERAMAEIRARHVRSEAWLPKNLAV